MRSKCISVASCLGVLSRVNKRRKWTAGKWHFLPCSKQKFNIAIICHARKMSLMIVQPLLKYLCDVCGFYFSPASERQLWITEHNFNELTVKWIFSCSFRQGEWEFITLMFFQLVVFKGKANPSRGLTDKERKMSKFLFSRFFSQCWSFILKMIYHFTHSEYIKKEKLLISIPSSLLCKCKECLKKSILCKLMYDLNNF